MLQAATFYYPPLAVDVVGLRVTSTFVEKLPR